MTCGLGLTFAFYYALDFATSSSSAFRAHFPMDQIAVFWLLARCSRVLGPIASANSNMQLLQLSDPECGSRILIREWSRARRSTSDPCSYWHKKSRDIRASVVEDEIAEPWIGNLLLHLVNITAL